MIYIVASLVLILAVLLARAVIASLSRWEDDEMTEIDADYDVLRRK